MARRTAAAKIEEVQDLESEPTPSKAMDITGGLTFVTFVALLVGLVLVMLSMKKYLGTGLFA
jgi:hypothetical protein